MTSSSPTEDIASGLSRTWCVVFQQGANSLTSIRLRPDSPLDEMTNILLGGYARVPSPASRHITAPVSEVRTLERIDLEALPVRDQQAAITGPNPVHPPGPPPLSNNNSFTSEVDSLREDRLPPVDGQHVSNETFPMRSKLSRSRMVVLVLGALSLIVAPGLVLGVVTKEIQWGIALSGAIATVVSFLAGLYYYHNK